jgi:hypothetical protein
MSPDEKEFQQLYRSLPSGLIVAACTPKSFDASPALYDTNILESFCRSLKDAAIRCRSDAMNFYWGYSRKNWLTKGIQHFRSFVEKHRANGIRVFLLNPDINEIDIQIACMIEETCLANNVTAVVLTVASDPAKDVEAKRLAVSKSEGIIFRKGGSASIILHHDRKKDNWYSAVMFIGKGSTQFGPLYYAQRHDAPKEQPKLFFGLRWS